MGFDKEHRNLSFRCEGRNPGGRRRKDPSTDAEHRGGDARSRKEGPLMGLDRRGVVIRSLSGGQPARG